MNFVKEFKSFILKGNVLDLAVAVIIGAAFGKIVTSFVGDVFMPLLSVLLGHVNFTDLVFVIREGRDGAEPIVLKYGNFMQTTVDFILIAFGVFLVIKVASKFKKLKEQTSVATDQLTKEEALLTEIRDLLKNRDK